MSGNSHFDETQVRKVFRAIDKTGRGGITVQELCQVMKRIGEDVTEADARNIVGQADTKGSGMITEDDFISYMQSRSADFNQLLRDAFQAMDIKKTGFLTHSQLRAGFAKAGMKLSTEGAQTDAVGCGCGQYGKDQLGGLKYNALR
uniref:EF-hand domain-containing protein n=1 Tax=Macrostomum lignano TaxID=282301 RepID=A0A1I8IXT4_9PLAT